MVTSVLAKHLKNRLSCCRRDSSLSFDPRWWRSASRIASPCCWRDSSLSFGSRDATLSKMPLAGSWLLFQ
jgi:hypothetical protein